MSDVLFTAGFAGDAVTEVGAFATDGVFAVLCCACCGCIGCCPYSWHFLLVQSLLCLLVLQTFVSEVDSCGDFGLVLIKVVNNKLAMMLQRALDYTKH